MKTYKNLFEKAVGLESLLIAWDGFKIGKRKKADVQAFEYRLEDNLFRLHDELNDKTYRHSPYYAFHIRDPKVRLIHKASVRDRVVHHAVFSVLNPIFEPTFIADSFSCRVGKGTHLAVKRLRRFLREVGSRDPERCFVLKCDIRKFFQSIDHEILYKMLVKRIKDPEMLWLIRTQIDSFFSGGSPPPERERERERDAMAHRLAILPPSFSLIST